MKINNCEIENDNDYFPEAAPGYVWEKLSRFLYQSDGEMISVKRRPQCNVNEDVQCYEAEIKLFKRECIMFFYVYKEQCIFVSHIQQKGELEDWIEDCNFTWYGGPFV